MPKYLCCGSYTADGLKGLQKDKASGRQQAVKETVEGLGGRLEAVYFALGEDDVYVFFDLPDNVSAAAVGIAANGSGLLRTRTIALMTVAEVDRALAKTVNFRAPGR